MPARAMLGLDFSGFLLLDSNKQRVFGSATSGAGCVPQEIFMGRAPAVSPNFVILF